MYHRKLCIPNLTKIALWLLTCCTKIFRRSNVISYGLQERSPGFICQCLCASNPKDRARQQSLLSPSFVGRFLSICFTFMHRSQLIVRYTFTSHHIWSACRLNWFNKKRFMCGVRSSIKRVEVSSLKRCREPLLLVGKPRQLVWIQDQLLFIRATIVVTWRLSWSIYFLPSLISGRKWCSSGILSERNCEILNKEQVGPRARSHLPRTEEERVVRAQGVYTIIYASSCEGLRMQYPLLKRSTLIR